MSSRSQLQPRRDHAKCHSRNWNETNLICFVAIRHVALHYMEFLPCTQITDRPRVVALSKWASGVSTPLSSWVGIMFIHEINVRLCRRRKDIRGLVCRHYQLTMVIALSRPMALEHPGHQQRASQRLYIPRVKPCHPSTNRLPDKRHCHHSASEQKQTSAVYGLGRSS